MLVAVLQSNDKNKVMAGWSEQLKQIRSIVTEILQ